MLKKISSLGTVLNKSEQKTIIGGDKQSNCFSQHGTCAGNASNELTNSLNDCVLASASCINNAAMTYGNSMMSCNNSFNSCINN